MEAGLFTLPSATGLQCERKSRNKGNSCPLVTKSPSDAGTTC
jgi:hypothetical protein